VGQGAQALPLRRRSAMRRRAGGFPAGDAPSKQAHQDRDQRYGGRDHATELDDQPLLPLAQLGA
jgi:hypothetical protein